MAEVGEGYLRRKEGTMTEVVTPTTLEALKAQLGEAVAKGDIAEMIRLGNKVKAHPDAKVVMEGMAKKDTEARAEEAKAKDALLAPIREAVVRALVKAGLAEVKDGQVWETGKAKVLKVTGLHVQLDADCKTVFTGGKVAAERKTGGGGPAKAGPRSEEILALPDCSQELKDAFAAAHGDNNRVYAVRKKLLEWYGTRSAPTA